MATYLTIGQRIGTHRRRLRLSQKDVAAAVGVRTATISDWERDLEEPQRGNLIKVCKLLGLAIGPESSEQATDNIHHGYQLVFPFETAELELRVIRKSADSVQFDLTVKRPA